MSIDRPVAPRPFSMPSLEEIFGTREIQSDIELGLLQMQILWILSRKSTHGYDIMKDLNKIRNKDITHGTLYPTLQRLEELKLVSKMHDGNRVIYTLTDLGKKTMNDSCLEFTKTFFGVFQDFVCTKCVQH